MTQQPVLVVEHEAQCPPGWVGEWLAETGRVVDVRRPYRGDDLPGRLDDHGGLLVLGGSMDAGSDDRHPWLGGVKHLLRAAAAEQVPALGICLGHQLAAVALGGSVHPNPLGQQIGVLDVGWSAAVVDDPLLGPVSGARRAVQWNNDVVAVLPPGAEVLARAVTGEVQAARFAPTVWGVQWHPEVGEEIVRAWADNDRDSAVERGVDVDEYVAAVAAARDELRVSWAPLATGFARMTREVAAPW
ncbi:MAG TPA: type 1 glutamine amidotransferase [Nocardioidaceae bacterium]|nr:type 1 glutamine amidotransferase [Nocardioidaceae bacterium]